MKTSDLAVLGIGVGATVLGLYALGNARRSRLSGEEPLYEPAYGGLYGGISPTFAPFARTVGAGVLELHHMAARGPLYRPSSTAGFSSTAGSSSRGRYFSRGKPTRSVLHAASGGGRGRADAAVERRLRRLAEAADEERLRGIRQTLWPSPPRGLQDEAECPGDAQPGEDGCIADEPATAEPASPRQPYTIWHAMLNMFQVLYLVPLWGTAVFEVGRRGLAWDVPSPLESPMAAYFGALVVVALIGMYVASGRLESRTSDPPSERGQAHENRT